MTKAIHKVKLATEDFIFMKLDIKKAFDSLEWEFLFAVLENFGFGPCFINYIRATTVEVASSALLNGRFTTPFPISCSIRQGCPLSALLFVVAMDVLSNMLTTTVIEGHMHGVSFLQLDYQIDHCIYVDDIHLSVEDTPTHIKFFLDLLTRFGEDSSLTCNWQKTHVVYLSDEDILARLLDSLLEYGWSWEDDINATKLLGIHIVDEIVPMLMIEQLRVELELGL